MMSNDKYKIELGSLADQVFRYIKQLILAGELECGVRIPEESIASRFGVSRTPVREALRRLSEYGLVDIHPRSRAVVVELKPADAYKIAQVRASLEVLSVRLLAKGQTDLDITELRRLATRCEQLASKGRTGQAFEADSELHLEFARQTGNSYLEEALKKLDAKVQLLRLIICVSPEVLLADMRQHGAIIDAIEAREINEAERLMNEHVLQHVEEVGD